MARVRREKAASGVYHVMLRGINHQRIFEDDKDYERFLETLVYVVQQYKSEHDKICCRFFAYCLMDNHVHLLMQEIDEELSKTMQRIEISYAYFCNQKYGRDGHFFRGRFRSEPVNDFDYFLTLLRYIHQNPVKGGLTNSVEDYPYSSWHEFQEIGYMVRRKSEPGTRYMVRICDVKSVLNRIEYDVFAELVNQNLPNDFDPMKENVFKRNRMSDDEVMIAIKKIGKCNSISEFQKKNQKEQTDIITSLWLEGATQRQIERVTGFGRSKIQRLVVAVSFNKSSLYLIGCYKSEEHKNWIEKYHSYNVKVDNCPLTKRPEFLILYNGNNMNEHKIYRLSNNVKITTKADLVEMDYPHPRSDKYFFFKILSEVSPFKLNLEDLLNIHNNSVFGTPLIMKGTEIKPYLRDRVHG